MSCIQNDCDNPYIFVLYRVHVSRNGRQLHLSIPSYAFLQIFCFDDWKKQNSIIKLKRIHFFELCDIQQHNAPQVHIHQWKIQYGNAATHTHTPDIFIFHLFFFQTNTNMRHCIEQQFFFYFCCCCCLSRHIRPFHRNKYYIFIYFTRL